MTKLEFKHKKIAILGAGAWGLSLAIHWVRKRGVVRLWDQLPSNLVQKKLKETLAVCHADLSLDSFFIFDSLLEAVHEVDYILSVLPSHALFEIISKLKSHLSPSTIFILATKGFDPATSQPLSELVTKELDALPVAVLSGPSFAIEVAAGLPTGVMIASKNLSVAQHIADLFASDYFYTTATDDMIGVQVGGGFKNLYAILVGISDGLGFGSNARSILITKSLAEMTQIAVSLGGKSSTITGLAGLGDLILTCTDLKSRNNRFGRLLGSGKSVEEAEKEIGEVVEGKILAAQMMDIAKKYQLKLPIATQIYAILFEHSPIKKTIETLLKTTTMHCV